MSKETITDNDIIRTIDNAVLATKLYGYGVSFSEEERIINDELMETLDKVVSRKDYIDLEEKVSKLIDASETAGFKRGFHIAMRIVVDGLRINDCEIK